MSKGLLQRPETSQPPHSAHASVLRGDQFRSTGSVQSGTVPCFAIHQRRVA